MTRDEEFAALRAVIGKRIRMSFEDGSVFLGVIDSVDDEGFTCGEEDGSIQSAITNE